MKNKSPPQGDQNFVIYTPHEILFGWWNEECDWWDMRHACGRAVLLEKLKKEAAWKTSV